MEIVLFIRFWHAQWSFSWKSVGGKIVTGESLIFIIVVMIMLLIDIGITCCYLRILGPMYLISPLNNWLWSAMLLMYAVSLFMAFICTITVLLLNCLLQPDIFFGWQLAFEAHDGQRRRSGEPFIIHPVEVARILAELVSVDGIQILNFTWSENGPFDLLAIHLDPVIWL